MKTNIYVRKIELGKEKKETLIKKIDKLGKFFDDDAVADIVVSEQKDKMIVEEAKLWLDTGTMFGEEGAGFERRNIACPRATLQQALERLERAIRK